MNAFGLCLLLLLLYTYAGYPLLVAAWARVAPRRARSRSDFEPSVSVCMTVHDGARYLEQKLASLQQLEYPAQKLEFLIFVDGCAESEALAHKLAQHEPRLRVFAGPRRQGKPAGLNRLRAEACGEVLLMTDVRQRLSPLALRALLEQLADPEVGCVSGSLVLLGKTGPGAYWRYEKFIRGSEARLGSLVGVSGSLYAIRRQDLSELPQDVLLDDMFVPLEVVRRRKLVTLSHEAEAYDEAYDDEREFGRKVRTLAGNYQLLRKLPWLLVPGKNPVWFQLVSHKLLRLLCPWALLGLAITSPLLALSPELPAWQRWFWQAMVLGQLACYGLAWLGERAGRLGSLARTFTVMNAAAVVGLWRFARGSQAVTW